MKNALRFALLLLVIMVKPCIIHAQTGWKWGVANVIPSCGFEADVTAIDRSGNTFEAGYVYGGYGTSYFGSIAVPISGGGEMVVTKIDSSGNYVWAFGVQNTNAFPVDMATDSAGNVYIYGYYYYTTCIIGSDTLHNPAYDEMYFLVKCSPTGNVVWAQNITGDAVNYKPMGNIGIDGAGNIYLTGGFTDSALTIGSTTLINANATNDSDDVFIVKLDTLGNPIWAKSFGGNNTDWPTAMAITGKGEFYIAGQYNSDTITIGTNRLTGSHNYLCKYDSAGTCMWAKNMDNHTFVDKMVADNIQNVYMTGYIDSNAILGTDTLVYAGGSTLIHGGDVLIAKYNSGGNVLWARSAGGDSTDIGWHLALDPCNNLWVCGSMAVYGWGTPAAYSMNFGSHALSQATGAMEPMFIAEYDNAGNYQTSMALPVGGDDWNGMGVDHSGNIYIIGDYYGAPVFGPDTLGYTVEELFFEAKYTYSPGGCSTSTGTNTATKELSATLAISLYPNPAASECTIQYTKPFPPGTVAMVYDMTGRLIDTYPLVGNAPVISVARMPPGMYTCNITIPGNSAVVKQLVIMR